MNFPWNLFMPMPDPERPPTLETVTLDALARLPILLVEDPGRKGRFDITFKVPTTLTQPSLPSPLEVESLTWDMTKIPSPDDIGPYLLALADDVAKCTKLVELDLRFPVGAFGDDEGLLSPLQSAAQVAFHTVMYAVCAPTPEVVFLDLWGISKCRPEDLSSQQLEPGYRKPGWVELATRSLIPGLSAQSYVRLPEFSRATDRSRLTHYLLTDIYLHRVPAGDFTVAVACRAIACLDHRLSGPDLNRILPHVTIPILFSLSLEAPNVDPAVLSDFITRHSSIDSMRYSPLQSGKEDVGLKIAPPPALPSLTEIHAVHPDALVALMDNIYPTEPETVQFTFSSDPLSSPRHLWQWLATRRKEPVKLHICISFHFNRATLDLKYDPATPTSEDIDAAKSLNLVETVKLDTMSVAQATEFMEWLKVLPALKRLEVRVDKGHLDKWVTFLREAVRTLGGGVEVYCFLLLEPPTRFSA
ncbi:hypothetical protein C8R46DRAFT_1309660 [Mycena filopes]|nr:hypothetical protein C8R46DRAFT_1309660 [Mycena filopes]